MLGAMICDIRLTRKSLFIGLAIAIIISDSIYFAEIKQELPIQVG
jgi:hypothetical protein